MISSPRFFRQFLPCSLLALMLSLVLQTGCGSPEPVQAPPPAPVAEAAPASTPAPEPAPPSSPPVATPRTDTRPNIVWILLDTLRAKNISAYGYPKSTSPNLDALAAQGLLFEQHYAQGNETLVSVPSYMTGRYFPVFCQSVGSWRQLAKAPPPEEKLFPEIARENGYHTAAFSSHPFYRQGSRLYTAFDEYHFIRGGTPGVNAHMGEVLQEVNAWLAAPRDKPFLLYVHVMDVHFPHPLRKGFLDGIDVNHPRAIELQGSGTPPYDEADQAFLQALYDNSIRFADRGVGLLCQALQAAGHWDNTLILVGSDHGELLAEDGQTVGHPNAATADEVFHVPLLLSGPGVPEGVRVAAGTENADIVPTLVDLLGFNTAATFDGQSLLKLIADPGLARPFILGKAEGTTDARPALVLRSPSVKWIYTENPAHRKVWRVPDAAGARQPLEAAEGPANFTTAMLAPLEAGWAAYAALPIGQPPVFTEGFPAPAGQETAYVAGTEDWTDNRWNWKGTQLASCGWREDAPPITFVFEVPPGTYEIELELVTGEREEHPASTFQVRAMGEATFRRVSSSVDQEGYNYYRLAPLGRYSVPDGRFEITFDDVQDGAWSVAHGLRFIPEGMQAPTAEEHGQGLEALRSLGYLGD